MTQGTGHQIGQYCCHMLPFNRPDEGLQPRMDELGKRLQQLNPLGLAAAPHARYRLVERFLSVPSLLAIATEQ
jgi:hypothetical protein